MLGLKYQSDCTCRTYISTSFSAQQAISAVRNRQRLQTGQGDAGCAGMLPPVLRTAAPTTTMSPKGKQVWGWHQHLLVSSLPSLGAAALPLADTAKLGQSVPKQTLRDEVTGRFARQTRTKHKEQHLGCRSHSRVCILFYTDSWAGAAFSFQGVPAVKEQNHTLKRKIGEMERCGAHRVPAQSQEPETPTPEHFCFFLPY